MSNQKPEEKSKGNKNVIIIIAVALLLVIGLIGGAGWFFMNKLESMEGTQGEAAIVEKKAPEVLIFIPLENFTLNLADPHHPVSAIGISIVSNSPDGEAWVKKNLPLLRDRFLNVMGSYTSEQLLSDPSRTKLKSHLLEELKKIDDTAKDFWAEVLVIGLLIDQ